MQLKQKQLNVGSMVQWFNGSMVQCFSGSVAASYFLPSFLPSFVPTLQQSLVRSFVAVVTLSKRGMRCGSLLSARERCCCRGRFVDAVKASRRVVCLGRSDTAPPQGTSRLLSLSASFLLPPFSSSSLSLLPALSPALALFSGPRFCVC